METLNKQELINPYMNYRNMKTCIVCGKEFEPKNIRGIYCGSLCRWRAYSIKKAGELMGIPIDEAFWQKPESSPSEETNAIQRKLTENATETNANPTHTNSELTETNAIQPNLTEDAAVTNANQRKLTEDAMEPNANQRRLTEVATETNVIQLKPTENFPVRFTDEKGSGFTDAIADIVNERGYDEKFCNPLQNWSPQQAEAITKINTCLRCLLESTLKLSRQRKIPAFDLRDIANAYLYVLQSKAFERSGHPYSEIIYELHRKLSNYYKQFRSNPKLRLVIRREDKIQIIAMLHEIGNSVPLRRFSELFQPEHGQY